MNKLFPLFFLIIFVSLANGQAPQSVCYQGVASDNQGNPLGEQDISIQFSVIQGDPSGNPVWIEDHTTTTDEFGLFTLNVGTGTRSGGSLNAFDAIDWGNGPYYLRIDIDETGGSNFDFLGTNQILSVPYALYADAAGLAQRALLADFADSSAVAGLAGIALFADSARVAGLADTALIALFADSTRVSFSAFTAIFADSARVSGSSTRAVFADSSAVSGYTRYADSSQVAFFSDSSRIALRALTAINNPNDLDQDPTNELQNLIYSNQMISITNGNSITLDVDDADADPTNEFQTLILDNTSLTLSNGNSVTLNVDDLDADPTNELQSLIFSNGDLSLTNGNTVTIDVDDADADPTNELQSLVYDNGSLTLTNGNTVIIDIEDADADPTNELQQLVYDGSTLSLTNGNTITFNEGVFGAPGADYDFPQGFEGQYLVLQRGTYTIPNGKNFYITASGGTVQLPQFSNTAHFTTPNMPVFPGGTLLEDCFCTGFLADTASYVDPVILNLDFVYTVPTGKVLFIKSGLDNDDAVVINVNGVDMEFMKPNTTRGSRIITFPGGTRLEKPDFVARMIVTAYLIDGL